MDFVIKNYKENIVSLAREIGYINIDTINHNEFSMVRKLTLNNYPRFHIYLKQQGEHYYFNLHLDQKAPIYKGVHAHNGEYEGPVIENEADRIKEILSASSADRQ